LKRTLVPMLSFPASGAALVALLLGVLALPSAAQRGKPTIVPEKPPTPQRLSDRKVALVDSPLHLSEFSSGRDGMEPSPALATQLTHITGFIQRSPVDGKVPANATEVWVGRTHSAIYFVFVCHDSRPESIRSHLARRENIFKDDHVSVLLDTFQDHRLGTLFTVNPAGVQGDAAYSEATGSDYSYDQVWDSNARITRGGWVALIAIPYLSLRFRPGVQDWGVVFQRDIPRNSESDFWPRIAASISGKLTQEGTLTGMSDIPRFHNIELNPYALAQNEHTLNTLYPLDPYFSSRKLEGTAGGDAKLVVKDSIVLDATVNPDFSQIESDQPRFTVNQRYPVHFPELRPFFLENAHYFATPITLLYTRNIVHPEFGTRATGKIGQFNLGFLAIDDRQPGEIYPPGDPRHGKRALFAVGRISRNFGEGSSVGAIYTDEEFGGSSNRIGGVDFTARFNDHWSALGQTVVSSTRGVSTPGTPASYSAGPASKLKLIRDGHAFSMRNTFRDYSTGFITQPGFIRTANIRSDSNNTHNQWYPKHGPLQSWGIETQNSVAFNHQGDRVFYQSQVNSFLALARGTILAPILGQKSDTLTPAEYSVLTADRNYTQNFGGLVFRSAPLPEFNFNIVMIYGGNVNYNPVTGAVPSLLHQNFLQALFTLQPIHPLTIDNTYLLDRDRSASDGVLALENQTLRTRINYQFTRAFSARIIVEYDSTLVNPAETSLVRTKQVSSSALLTWLPHPGTAIYIGYNNALANLDRTLCSRGPGGMCDPTYAVLPRSTQYLNNGRQLFIKASYLLRF
jgi:hypothetical protein